jgi:hypothetical protein
METPPQVLNEGRKGMRLLLISDTHGKLSTINELSSRVQADAVIRNLLPGPKMMQRPIAGGGGKIWSTLSQYAELVEAVDRDGPPAGPRLFVSHVSPGKEPFVELVGARTRADYTISGHMGAPTCMVWNPFALSSVDEAQQKLRDGLDAVKDACAQTLSPWAEQTLSFIGQIPPETITIGRGVKAPHW